MASVEILRRDCSVAQLRAEAARTADAKQARRILAIAMVLDGHARLLAAQACGMDRQTLRDWVHRYNDEALTGLAARPRSGPQTRLSESQRCERLSSWSSVLPFGFCPDDRVENGEELTETGDDGDFFWSAALNEALIGGFDEGIVPDGDERGHVQDVADAASSAANHAMAAPCARISVEWSDADERGQLAAIERT